MAVRFLYPLESDFLDATGNFGAAVGASSIVSDGQFPVGSGYDNPNGFDSNRLNIPSGIMENQGTGPWTLEFWARGFDWDGLSSIQNGIFATRSGVLSNRILIRTSSTSDNFALTIVDSASNGQGVDTSFAAVNAATHFFSLTRSGDKVYYHIGGVLRATITLTAGASAEFNFGSNSNRFLSSQDVSSALDGRVSEIRFSDEALYDGTNYTEPTDPLGTTSCSPELTFPIPDREDFTGDVISTDYSYYFSTPEGKKTTYAATSLPTGLTMDEDGIVTGTVDPGISEGTDFTVTVTATNECGNKSDVFTWTIGTRIVGAENQGFVSS